MRMAWLQKAFTGVSFGKYFIEGEQVDRATYMAQHGDKADQRPNSLLDDAFNPSPPAAKPAAKPQGDPRANALLDEVWNETDEPARHPSTHNPEITYGNEDDRDSDDKHFSRGMKQAAKKVQQAKAKLNAAIQAGPKSPAVDALKEQLRLATERVEGLRSGKIKPTAKPRRGRKGKPAAQTPVPPAKPTTVDEPPPPKAGHVRLYHGGNFDPSQTPGYDIQRGRQSEGPWVSENRQYGEGYARKVGGSLHYIDLPADHPVIQANSDHESVEGTGMKAPIRNFELPHDIAKAGLKPHVGGQTAHATPQQAKPQAAKPQQPKPTASAPSQPAKPYTRPGQGGEDTPLVIYDSKGKAVGEAHDENHAASEAHRLGGQYGIKGDPKRYAGKPKPSTSKPNVPAVKMPPPLPRQTAVQRLSRNGPPPVPGRDRDGFVRPGATAYPPKLPTKTPPGGGGQAGRTPPPLPHARTHQAATAALQAAKQTPGPESHSAARKAIEAHRQEGLRHIARMARQKHGQTPKGRQVALATFQRFNANLDRALAGLKASPPPLPTRKGVRLPWLVKAFQPVTKGKGKERWITIGGKKSEDGERSGGARICIENGKVKYGPAKLMDRKISNLSAPPEDSGNKSKAKESAAKAKESHAAGNLEEARAHRADAKKAKDKAAGEHRSELARGKQYAVAKLRKEARKDGHNPDHVQTLADEIQEHHNAFLQERKELLQHARAFSKSNHGADLTRRGDDKFVGGHEDEGNRGFDETAADTAKRFPGHFREETAAGGGSHEDQLRAMLSEGNPEMMTHEDAFEQALSHFNEMKNEAAAKASDDWTPWDDDAPAKTWRDTAKSYKDGGVIDSDEADGLRATYADLDDDERTEFARHFNVTSDKKVLPDVRDDLVERKIREMAKRGDDGPAVNRHHKNQLFGERGVGESDDLFKGLRLTWVQKNFNESDHPRDHGQFASKPEGDETESRERSVAKLRKEAIGKQTVSQKRAAKGGEVGANGEDYRAGAFIATQDLPKKVKDKLKKSATGKVRVGMSGFAVPEPGMMSIVDKLGGTVMNPRNGEINHQYLDYIKVTTDEREMYAKLAKMHTDGKEWVSVEDYPTLANFTDAARLYVAGKKVPDALVSKLPEEIRGRINSQAKKSIRLPWLRKSHDAAGHEHAADGKFASGGHAERLKATLGKSRSPDFPQSEVESTIAEVRNLDRPAIHALYVAAGVEGSKPTHTKAALLQRLRNALTAARRSRERASA